MINLKIIKTENSLILYIKFNNHFCCCKFDIIENSIGFLENLSSTVVVIEPDRKLKLKIKIVYLAVRTGAMRLLNNLKRFIIVTVIFHENSQS